MVGVPISILSNERGTKMVIFDTQRNLHVLLHGTTAHGMQSRDPTRAQEPLAYYCRSGPLGDVFQVVAGPRGLQVGIIGLGAGCMAAYARPVDHFTFCELDPDVARIAQDTACFTFLSACRGSAEVVVGDGLEKLGDAPDNSFDLLVIDAFDADAIPEHLHTQAALAFYRLKSRGDGLVLFHVSSAGVGAEAAIKASAESLGLAVLKRADVDVSEAERMAGKLPSVYVAVTGNRGYMDTLCREHHWQAELQPADRGSRMERATVPAEVMPSGAPSGNARPGQYCPQCGYDLRGQTVSRCPECGFGYEPRALESLSRQAFYGRIERYLAAVPPLAWSAIIALISVSLAVWAAGMLLRCGIALLGFMALIVPDAIAGWATAWVFMPDREIRGRDRGGPVWSLGNMDMTERKLHSFAVMGTLTVCLWPAAAMLVGCGLFMLGVWRVAAAERHRSALARAMGLRRVLIPPQRDRAVRRARGLCWSLASLDVVAWLLIVGG